MRLLPAGTRMKWWRFHFSRIIHHQLVKRYHMNPQECLDAPRFQWTGGLHIQLEREVPAHISAELALRGHEVEVTNHNLAMGGDRSSGEQTTGF